MVGRIDYINLICRYYPDSLASLNAAQVFDVTTEARDRAIPPSGVPWPLPSGRDDLSRCRRIDFDHRGLVGFG